MKHNLPYIITISLFITHLIVYQFDKASSNDILNWTMLLSFLYFFFYGLVRLIQKNFNEGVLALSTAVIILTVELKLWFYFYNVYVNFIVLTVVGIVFYFLFKKFKAGLQQLSFPLFFLLIGFGVNQISDLKVFQHVSSMVSYQSLTWNNFRGEVDHNSSFDASIKAGINFKVNQASNPTKLVLFAGMIPEKSWVKRSSEANEDSSSDWLLDHEQRHFDLVKIHEILLTDSLKKVEYHPKIYEGIIRHFSQKEDSTSKYYDEVTSHGLLHLNQRTWNNRIDSILESQQIPLLSGNDRNFREMQKKAVKQAKLCVSLNDTITKIFNSRNKFIIELNTQRKGDGNIDRSLLSSIDSISKKLEYKLNYSILEIESRDKVMLDQELFAATIDFLNEIRDLELVFQPFLNSIKTSNYFFEQELSGPLQEKGSKIELSHKHWVKVKDEFLKKYELYSEDLE